jgi:acetylglutamate kinase
VSSTLTTTQHSVLSTPHSLSGAKIVVKLGGEVMLNSTGLDSLASQVAVLAREAVQVVVVHGGGPQADTLAETLGHKVRKVAGRRVTDDNALFVAKMIFAGSINTDLMAALVKHGARPVGLSGVDAGIVQVTRRPPVPYGEEWVDFGHVGDVQAVDTSLLSLLLDNGYIPVIASLAADTEGNVYNINADTVAQSIAVALNADRLIILTNVPGILREHTDSSTLIPTCTVEQINELVADGTISGGMLPKVRNCIEALEAGIPSVQILDGTIATPPLVASLIQNDSLPSGTLITK